MCVSVLLVLVSFVLIFCLYGVGLDVSPPAPSGACDSVLPLHVSAPSATPLVPTPVAVAVAVAVATPTATATANATATVTAISSCVRAEESTKTNGNDRITSAAAAAMAMVRSPSGRVNPFALEETQLLYAAPLPAPADPLSLVTPLATGTFRDATGAESASFSPFSLEQSSSAPLSHPAAGFPLAPPGVGVPFMQMAAGGAPPGYPPAFYPYAPYYPPPGPGAEQLAQQSGERPPAPQFPYGYAYPFMPPGVQYPYAPQFALPGVAPQMSAAAFFRAPESALMGPPGASTAQMQFPMSALPPGCPVPPHLQYPMPPQASGMYPVFPGYPPYMFAPPQSAASFPGAMQHSPALAGYPYQQQMEHLLQEQTQAMYLDPLAEPLPLPLGSLDGRLVLNLSPAQAAPTNGTGRHQSPNASAAAVSASASAPNTMPTRDRTRGRTHPSARVEVLSLQQTPIRAPVHRAEQRPAPQSEVRPAERLGHTHDALRGHPGAAQAAQSPPAAAAAPVTEEALLSFASSTFASASASNLGAGVGVGAHQAMTSPRRSPGRVLPLSCSQTRINADAPLSASSTLPSRRSEPPTGASTSSSSAAAFASASATASPPDALLRSDSHTARRPTLPHKPAADAYVCGGTLHPFG